MPATSGGRSVAVFRRETRGTVTVRVTAVLLAVTALCVLGPRVSRAAGPAFEGLPYLAGEAHHSGANGVSADGSVVVGFARAGGHSRAVRWEAGRVERVGFLPGEAQSEANAVSADGSVVVGRAYISSMIPEVPLRDRAFRWQAGAVADLGALGPPSPTAPARSAADGVSGDGSVVVGSAASAASAASPATTALAFAWSNGAMRGLGDVPGGDFYSHATDVSRDGAVVVGGGVVAGSGPDQKYEAFRWTAE